MNETVLQLRLSRSAFELSVDVNLPARGITAVYGVSGSGKSTLLRCIAGLEPAAYGVVQVAGQRWQDSAQGVWWPTHRRPLGYVFQEASLFEHLDVQGNLTYGLTRSGRSDSSALNAAVELLGIGHLLRRRSVDLSGGERQRVAIARALATQPQVLLLDEPLAALDSARRQDILPWLEKLRDELQIPMLYVTHAIDEVARLASTVLLLEHGKARAVGSVTEALGSLHDASVWADAAGALLEAWVTALDTPWHLAQVSFEGGSLWLRDPGLSFGQQVRVQVLARDVSLTLSEARDTSIQNHLPCVVEELAPDVHPAHVVVRLRVGPSALLARITARAAHDLKLAPGSAAWAQVKSVALVK